jgi:predicted AlkP superfamily phosphohydrolase/phosphomutase
MPRPNERGADRAKRRRAEAGAPADPSRRAALKKLAALGALAAFDIGALASCGRKSVGSRAAERKVIVLGLDGLDPRLVARWMAEGKLPNIGRLAKLSGFHSVTSSIPPQSPVAWATFITGRNPGGHGIFDFIERDPKTYIPYFSIARTTPGGRALPVGEWKLPLSGAKAESLREGRAFWELLCEQGVPCSIYRMPTNYPTQDTGAEELAGLGAPDLLGSYGEFSYYTEAPPPGSRAISGGAIYRVTVSNGHVRARLVGPENTLHEGNPSSSADFDVWLDRERRVAKIAVQGQEVMLRQGEWSDWVPVMFEMVPHLKGVTGICRFYLKEAAPHLKLYVSPINVDPANPALPIAAPSGFASELAERFGRFYTMGFPEDVKALRHGILDDREYLEQTAITVSEARRMYEGALNDFQRGLLFYYFSATDRTQHMFWRAMDPQHPAYNPRLGRDYGSAIEQCYREADDIVGQTMEAADAKTTVIVMSDHGFAPFYHAFNLNTWLAQNGYLAGRQPWEGKLDLFSNANWPNTLAYGLGFNGLYLNLEGREAEGRVSAEEREAVLQRLSQDLSKARDPKTGERVIERVHTMANTASPQTADRAPDLVVGYANGYRCSDESVLGEVQANLVQDNTDAWSGDHCVDRSLVPGVLVANKAIRAEAPALLDVTAAVLAEFGMATPKDMEGEPIW